MRHARFLQQRDLNAICSVFLIAAQRGRDQIGGSEKEGRQEVVRARQCVLCSAGEYSTVHDDLQVACGVCRLGFGNATLVRRANEKEPHIIHAVRAAVEYLPRWTYTQAMASKRPQSTAVLNTL